MARDRLGEIVVQIRHRADRGVAVEHLQPGRGLRQQVHVDAGLVHLRQPERADVEQAVHHRALAGEQETPHAEEARIAYVAGVDGLAVEDRAPSAP